jgi:hypothetical protein
VSGGVTCPECRAKGPIPVGATVRWTAHECGVARRAEGIVYRVASSYGCEVVYVRTADGPAAVQASRVEVAS